MGGWENGVGCWVNDWRRGAGCWLRAGWGAIIPGGQGGWDSGEEDGGEGMAKV